jgi:hypothetical protein
MGVLRTQGEGRVRGLPLAWAAIGLLAGGCGVGRSVRQDDAAPDAPGPDPGVCIKLKSQADCQNQGCSWMPRGCGPPPPGHLMDFCYAPPLKTCLPGGCPGGSVCTGVWIDPCAGSACTACGGQASYCLPAP